jgi:hypothetical protein
MFLGMVQMNKPRRIEEVTYTAFIILSTSGSKNLWVLIRFEKR